MRLSTATYHRVSRPLFLICALAAFSTGCDDETPTDDGGTPPPGADANASDDANIDATPEDSVSHDASGTDRDAGCACTPADSGTKGVQSLACFCSRSDVCPTYDIARSRCRDGAETRLDVYAGCGLEIISFPELLVEGRKFVYDATTHTLVGASFATDTLSLQCGAQLVTGYQAGTFPPPDCAISQTISLCPGDSGTAGDGDVTDGGCACTTSDASSGPGRVSLACYCNGGFGECPTYDVALQSCPQVAPPEFNRLEEYAGCNYAVITSGGGLGGSKYVYDFTTHALVGASRFTDTNTLSCDVSRVFGYEAGAFPDPSCVLTRVVTRCEGDAGDASTADR
jgi:hypothetical protein